MAALLKLVRGLQVPQPQYEPVPLEPLLRVDEQNKDEHFKDDHVEVWTVEIDTAAQIAADTDSDVDITPEEALRVRKKIDWHILPMMCTLYWMGYMDKTTLGSAAILGIREATHLSNNEYNMLGTIFYIGYLIFEYPQNLALQRFPVAKWLSLNVAIWGISLCAHALCTNFAGLFVARFILGVCEGSITSGFMIISSMFYTRNEQTLRVGYWFLMNGTAQIISGFISFGTLHIPTQRIEPWQWLMSITGSMTLIVALVFWLYFPDSPTTAWFLTHRERAVAVSRLKENQTGVENKSFKREQFYEALQDPKTWLFALFSALNNIPNSLTNQSQLIVASFGFSYLQTTLLGCVDGIIEIVTIWTGVHLATRLPDARAYIGAVYFIPNILGSVLIQILPWENRIGLLCAQWLTGIGTTGFVLSISWLSNVTAGHTKRVTVNAVVLIAYCIGNALGPFMWQERFRPRNYLPWTVIALCYVACPLIFLAIRLMLAAENRRRDLEPHDVTYDDVYITVVGPDGGTVEKKVDKEFLDLTDVQNRDFRYVL